ncbi:MAG: hypothetical protein Nk1A_6660 [Endomicrobiia bacterium]|nr:MAG: hypothetical protein Nk1A_6660 [Endomicrobiia bacterium]
MKKLYLNKFSILFVAGAIFVCSSMQLAYAKCTPIVSKGQVVKNEVISAGETQMVCNGGKTINVTIEEGGRHYVHAKGSAIGTKIKALGFQYVGDGGWAGQTIIEEKGLQIVSGAAPETLISGGVQLVDGMTLFSKIENGGMEIICRSGASTDTTINDGAQHINGFSFGTLGRRFKLNKDGIRNVYSASYVLSKEKKDPMFCIKIEKIILN